MKSLKCATLVLAGAAGIASIAWAAAPGDVIVARQTNFKTMGRAMRSNMQQLTSGNPDIAVIRDNADQLSDAAQKVTGYFPKGTGPGGDVKTSALPAIWEKQDEFRRDAKNLVEASARLKAIIASGKVDQFQPAMATVSGTCKSCHDSFRAHEG